MDISYLKNNSLKIKGKTAAIIIDPTSKLNKTEGDGVLVLWQNPDFNESKIQGSRIRIQGPGEYEIGGIKISCLKVEEKLVANMDVDNVKVLVGEGGAVEKIHDKVEECNIVIVRADEEFNSSVLTSLEPNVLLVLGEKKEEVARSLGKSEADRISKFSTSLEKLPSEMELVLLG